MNLSPRHIAARELAAKGVPVFPCVPNEKRPAVKRGFHDATTDLAQIDAWWGEADYNVAFSPEAAGLCVIDVEKDGINAWEMLCIENGESDTFTVDTPGGGFHAYFRGSLPGTVGRLAPRIDTRGRGSYVLWPPSVVQGRLYAARDSGTREREVLPAWVEDRLSRARKTAASAGLDEDRPENITRAISFLENRAPVDQGNGADARTYEAACVMRDLGLSQDKAAEVLLAHYKCQPQDERYDAFIARKVENAYAGYAQNEAGAWAIGSSQDAFGAAVAAEPAPARTDVLFKLWTPGEIAREPEPQWLIQDMIPEASVGMIYAPTSSFKTYAMIATAMPLALERPVVFIAGEGPWGVSARVNAWCEMNGVERDQHKLKIVRVMPQTTNPDRGVNRFIDDLERQDYKPAMVIIDTAARAMYGLDESSARDAGIFVQAMEEIKWRLGATVALIHHTGKDAARGARGSSALRGAFDFEIEIERNENAVALWVRKQRDFEERKEPWCFEARRLGRQTVLCPISRADYRTLTDGTDVIAPKIVGAALLTLGAKGEANGVTTHNLAVELAGPEATDEQVSLYKRALGARANNRLEAYSLGSGHGRTWCLPG